MEESKYTQGLRAHNTLRGATMAAEQAARPDGEIGNLLLAASDAHRAAQSLEARVAGLEQALCGLCQMLGAADALAAPGLRIGLHPQLLAWFDQHRAQPGCEAKVPVTADPAPRADTHAHDAKRGGWIGVDLDGTLAHYEGWKGATHIGEPVGEMLFRVKKWLADGWEVRIMTARCWPLLLVNPGDSIARTTRLDAPGERQMEAHDAVLAIHSWCKQYIGQALAVTCVKDYRMFELWDDRAVQVEPNTGRPIGASTRGL